MFLNLIPSSGVALPRLRLDHAGCGSHAASIPRWYHPTYIRPLSIDRSLKVQSRYAARAFTSHITLYRLQRDYYDD
jgi:hypothetical protein